jgi:hypothetical protein
MLGGMIWIYLFSQQTIGPRLPLKNGKMLCNVLKIISLVCKGETHAL